VGADNREPTCEDKQNSQPPRNEVSGSTSSLLPSGKDDSLLTTANEQSGHNAASIGSKHHEAVVSKPASEVAVAAAHANVSDGDVENIVKDCWKKIEDQRQRELVERKEKKKPDSESRGWKTIRVFVSSTFTDMHSEREILIKKVNVRRFECFCFLLLRLNIIVDVRPKWQHIKICRDTDNVSLTRFDLYYDRLKL
jgi:Domain of unknown function (DUF4062)